MLGRRDDDHFSGFLPCVTKTAATQLIDQGGQFRPRRPSTLLLQIPVSEAIHCELSECTSYCPGVDVVRKNPETLAILAVVLFQFTVAAGATDPSNVVLVLCTVFLAMVASRQGALWRHILGCRRQAQRLDLRCRNAQASRLPMLWEEHVHHHANR